MSVHCRESQHGVSQANGLKTSAAASANDLLVPRTGYRVFPFGGDRYPFARSRASLRTRIPAAYSQAEWALMKVGIRRALAVTARIHLRPRAREPLVKKSKRELESYLRAAIREKTGKSVLIVGDPDEVKDCLVRLGLIEYTTLLQSTPISEPLITSRAPVSPVQPEESVRRNEDLVCSDIRRKYTGFRADGSYGGIATGLVVGCCLKCVFCWSNLSQDDPGADIRYYTAEEVLDELLTVTRKYGTAKAKISGGEPTLGREHLLSLLRLVEGSPIRLFILETNGIPLGLDVSYVRELSGFKKVHVRLSLKAGTPEEFGRKTGASPEAFELAFDGIRNLLKYKVRLNIAAMSADSRMMSPAERSVLLEKLNSINPALKKTLEEEEVEPYGPSLLHLQRAGFHLSWPQSATAVVNVPIRCGL